MVQRWVALCVVAAGLLAPAPVRGDTTSWPRPHDTAAARKAGRDAGPKPRSAAPAAAASGATFRVFATQYNPNTAGSVEVAIPDKCAKFASLGWTSALGSASCPSGYELGMDWRVRVRRDSGAQLAIPVKDVGPWNVDDNYWNPPTGPRPRRLFRDVARGTPEAQAAFYDGYNTVPNCKTLSGTPSGHAGPADQFGRCVLNPAGIDLSVAAAAKLGLGHLQNEWVTVTFLWERESSSGQAHVLWHNRETGKVKRWKMSATRMKRSSVITRRKRVKAPAAQWMPIATGDFNRDGQADLLWWNRDTNVLKVWFMKGATRIGRTKVDPDGASLASDWRPFAVDDFDDDGRPDIVWHNRANGHVSIWYMKRTTRRSSTTVDLPSGESWPSSDWTPFATIDFDGNDTPDVAWHNASTGRVMLWYLSGSDGNKLRSSTVITRGPGIDWPSPSTWVPVGAGPFDGEGAPDVLWHNTSNGTLVVWKLRGDDGSEASDAVRVTASSFPGPPNAPLVWR